MTFRDSSAQPSRCSLVQDIGFIICVLQMTTSRLPADLCYGSLESMQKAVQPTLQSRRPSAANCPKFVDELSLLGCEPQTSCTTMPHHRTCIELLHNFVSFEPAAHASHFCTRVLWEAAAATPFNLPCAEIQTPDAHGDGAMLLAAHLLTLQCNVYYSLQHIICNEIL